MKDPEEKDQQQEQDSADKIPANEREDNKDSNWYKNQRVDEEGNELGPDDVK